MKKNTTNTHDKVSVALQTTKGPMILKFAAHDIPVPYESYNRTDDKYVTYGLDNLYPYKLLDWYGECPIHAAITNSKATYIQGDGLKFADGSDIDFQANPLDSLQSLVDKITKDFLIFNYFAVEVLYQNNRPIEYHFIPGQLIRTNKSKTKFWYCEDWINARNPRVYDRHKKNNKDSTSKIFFFEGYFPSTQTVYPSPEYAGSIKAIATDIAIRDFNLNNIKNNFSASSIITIFAGSNISDEQKEAFMKDLKNSYTGENGKKMIVDFQDPGTGKGAEVNQLAPNDWSEAYEVLRNDVADDIYKGHSVTSPSLFGVKTVGQLGGNQELETAYEIFKNTVIRVKRAQLESALNDLFNGNENFTQKVAFADKPLFQTRLSEQTKLQIMTVNELREMEGLENIDGGDVPAAQFKVAQQPTLQPGQPGLPTQQPQLPSQEPAIDQQQQSGPRTKKLADEDYDRIAHLGIAAGDFEILEDFKSVFSMEHARILDLKFDNESDIADYVIKNDIKGISLDELKVLIRKDIGLNVTANELQSTLQSLHEAGVVKVNITEGKVNISPAAKADLPETRKIETMYQYQVRPGLGEPLIENSRGFCVKLVNNDRLYTREDIQEMSAIFGYDIFQFCGGFYHNPTTGETTPYCRHQWVQRKVSRKTAA